jgi:hypothetical protein
MPAIRRQGFRRIGRADNGERIRRSHEQQDDAKKLCISTVFFALHNYLQILDAVNMPLISTTPDFVFLLRN